MADELDRQRVDARRAGELARRELGQLAVVAARQVLPHVVDLGGDQVVVVEDPLRRRSDELAAMDVAGERAVRLFEEAGVLLEPRDSPERDARRGDGSTVKRAGERLGALLEQLDAQQLVAKRPVQGWRRAAEEPFAGQGAALPTRSGTRSFPALASRGRPKV